MLKITVLAVGSLKERHWRAAQEEYLTRLRPMARLGLVEVPHAPITPSFGAEKSIEKEAEALVTRIPDEATVVALTVEGTAMSSEKLAERLRLLDEEARHVCLVIGGAAGLGDAVLSRADWQLSLSPMTLTHEMARVLLLEQIYRGLAINSGKKYHY
jgi:23S rRNA (pseudouridine1915-N3)-methyltransferase